MANFLPVITLGAQLIGGLQQKRASDKAAAAAAEASEFNAQIIERDIDLLEKTRGILNANFLVSQNRKADAFEREVQGTARSGFGYAGVDMSVGTPIAVLRSNAREFDYEQKVREFDNSVQNMQIDDEQEGLRLAAELSRKEGGMQAAGLRASSTASLISSIGKAASYADDVGIFS